MKIIKTDAKYKNANYYNYELYLLQMLIRKKLYFEIFTVIYLIACILYKFMKIIK